MMNSAATTMTTAIIKLMLNLMDADVSEGISLSNPPLVILFN